MQFDEMRQRLDGLVIFRELLQDEEPAPAKKRSSVIPLAILAVLELAAIAAVVVWWLQWLR